MNVVELIKGDREISLKNWRYVLLHWFFGTEQGKTMDKYQFFYTHFCPLFHATNLILLFAPFILLYKISWVLIRVFFYSIGFIITKLHKGRVVPETSPEEWLTNERNELISFLRHHGIDSKHFVDWEYFNAHYWLSWHNSDKHPDLKKKLWEELVPLVKKQIERAEQHKKLMAERISFWINFSRVFFKFGLYAIYLVIGYLMLRFGIPLTIGGIKLLCSTVVFLCTINWLAVGQILAGMLIVLAIGVGIVFGIFYAILKNQWISDYILPPFTIVSQIAFAFFGFIFSSIENTLQFVKMFYEDHCPKITIVEKEI